MSIDGNAEVIRCPVCGKRNRVPAASDGIPQCGSCHSPLPWVADAGDDTYGDVVEEASIPVLVDLWAPWCGPCHLVSPALDQLANDFAGKVKLVKINVDESASISSRLGVQGIPTLLVTRKGEVIARRTGAASESALRTWLEDALSNAAA